MKFGVILIALLLAQGCVSVAQTAFYKLQMDNCEDQPTRNHRIQCKAQVKKDKEDFEGKENGLK